MPRENSFSDEGRSLTPDPEDEVHITASSPTYSVAPRHLDLGRVKSGQSKKSVRSKMSKAQPSSAAPTRSALANLPPLERFRVVARRVMSMHRGMSLLSTTAGAIGAEPGVDPRRPAIDAAYKHIHQECAIEIMDYSAIRSTSRKMNNSEFVEFMDVESEDVPPREPWVKVRWINIGGMSWDVIKAVSIKYGLHPLALEDVFHGHSRNRSKADYYTKHLFLRVLCHELLDDDAAPQSFTNAPRSASPEPMSPGASSNEKDSEDFTNYSSTMDSTLVNKKHGYTRTSILPTNMGEIKSVHYNDAANSRPSPPRTLTNLARAKQTALKAHRDIRADENAVQALKQGSRVNVHVSPMFFFLLRDGTVISIRNAPNLDMTAPITARLKSRDTVLRKSADPSILLHALLDLLVDKAVQVIDQYHAKIHKFERDILLRPKMNTVRQLHILSGDLILHKRTLDPIKTLIYSLRRYDVDRVAALIDSSDPANKDVQVVGFMSHKSKIYLADVYDHMEYILTSLDMFASIAENLINYTFNMASYEMNEVMRRLTLATIIFLPMTVLTGYFGMNFENMWSIHHGHSDIIFWEIAIPILVLVIPIALIGDLRKLWHFIQHKRDIKKMY